MRSEDGFKYDKIHTERTSAKKLVSKDKCDAKCAELERYKKALDLALYYVEGDSTWEALSKQIGEILTAYE